MAVSTLSITDIIWVNQNEVRISMEKTSYKIILLSLCVLLQSCGGGSSNNTSSETGGDDPMTGSVSGFVTNSDDGSVLADVLVQVEDLESRTSNEGSYTINGISSGERILTASKSGYQNHNATISIDSAMTTSYDIVLNPDPSQIPTEGLVAYYPFNGNADDSSDNNNNGVEIGGVSYVNSNFDQALSLDGSTGYVRVANPDQQFDSEFTITVWMATEFHWGQVVTKYQYNGLTDGFGLFVTDENGSGGINPDGSRLFTHASSFQSNDPFSHPSFTLVPNQMSKVAFVYDNGTSKLYINDELKEEKTLTSVSLDNQYDILIGTYFDRNRVTIEAFSKGYKGLIDELRIYNRALSEEELRAIP